MTNADRAIRGHVRNYLCGATEAECHNILAREYNANLPSANAKVAAIIEWCCEDDFRPEPAPPALCECGKAKDPFASACSICKEAL